jgi:hypothetical protein
MLHLKPLQNDKKNIFRYKNDINVFPTLYFLFYALVIASAAHLSELEYDNGTEETSSKAVSEVEIMLHHVARTLPHVTT